MKILLIAWVLLGTLDCVGAVTLSNVEVVEFGTYRKTDIGGNMAAPRAVTGTANVVKGATLIERTTEIHASKGTSFGLGVKAFGQPDGAVLRFTCRCIHPQFTDPVSGRTSTVEQWDSQTIIGRVAHIGYTFDDSWELVPGNWTIQIFYGATLVARKEFNVVLTTPASNPAIEPTASGR